jgi:hypothetical protein
MNQLGMWRVKYSLPVCAFALCLFAVGPICAQQPVSSNSCNPWLYQPPSEAFSFKQRACFHLAALTTPSLAARGAALAGLGAWRDDREDFGHRYATFYARHSARAAGELIAGYLNHEDPLPHVSLEHGTWNRTRSALLSVVRVQDANGRSRPALAPIAGSFGSGFVGMAISPIHNNWNSGLTRTELTYSTYFAAAVAREFKPDLSLLANRLLHRKQ